MENEIWKDIEGYEGHYQISNYGNVYSLKTNKILKQSLCSLIRNKEGYKQLALCVNGKAKTKMTHRLVAQAFISNPENKREVNHINGNKHDNHAENLEWMSAKENHNHAINNGMINDSGENNSRAVLTNQQAREIRALNRKKTQREIANIYGICESHVSQIIRNKLYKNA